MVKSITETANTQYGKCENNKILNLNSKCPATKQGKLKRVGIAGALAMSQLLHGDYLVTTSNFDDVWQSLFYLQILA